jgi:ribulose-phosphate 3-epimerase
MEHELEIIPAIIPKHFRELEEKLEIIKGVSETIHIDICDGQFTQEASWPLAKPDENFRSIINEERGMPFWEDFDFEFHLMVREPFAIIPDLIKAGASKIIIHAESINLDNDQLLLDQLRTDGVVELGIAFKLNTPLEDVKEFIPFADFILFMAIDHLGFQGQVFNPNVVDKIKWLHTELPTMRIAIDGGMNPDTAGVVYDAGASKIIVGSYILNSVSPMDAKREVESAI